MSLFKKSFHTLPITLNTKAAVRKPEGLLLYEKAIPAKVFSYELFEIFKNSFFIEHLQTTTSANVDELIFSSNLRFKEKNLRYEKRL